MTYFPDLHTYLHHSSLLLQAYPLTTRITTKYSQPRRPKTPSKSKPSTTTTTTSTGTSTPQPSNKRDPSATLTLKTYHPDSGICLKYTTDKAAEVGRLMTGLGRLAKGEVIELPKEGEGEIGGGGAGIVIGGGATTSSGGPAQGDRMDVDSPTPSADVKTATQMTGGGGAGGAKKKGKKGKK